MLPSSHCSPGSRWASPHIGTGSIVQAPPWAGQVQPAVTCMQLAEQPFWPVVLQPSPAAPLPSSHCSPVSRMASPHHGASAVGTNASAAASTAVLASGPPFDGPLLPQAAATSASASATTSFERDAEAASI